LTVNFSENDLKQVGNFWGKAPDHKSSIDLYSFIPIRRYFQKLVTGTENENPTDDWLEKWFKNKYLSDKAPVDLCLSLCCGHGSRDRRLNKLGIFKECIGIMNELFNHTPDGVEIVKNTQFEAWLQNLYLNTPDGLRLSIYKLRNSSNLFKDLVR
jgi:hypothetical protein